MVGSGGATEAGRDGGGGGAAIGVPAYGSGEAIVGTRIASGSNADREPICNAPVTNRDKTSSVAESDAADVCARSIEGSALLARLLAQAATRSLTAWCSSSAVR
jgi:hypothetical protein